MIFLLSICHFFHSIINCNCKGRMLGPLLRGLNLKVTVVVPTFFNNIISVRGTQSPNAIGFKFLEPFGGEGIEHYE